MNKSRIHSILSLNSNRRPRRLTICLTWPAAGLALALAVFSARADVVVLDDDFNDPNNNLAINTNGIGSGFTSQTVIGGSVSETTSLLRLDIPDAGWSRASAASIDAITINGGGTRYEFRGVSFQKDSANFGTGNTDRLYLGLGNASTAGDWQANPPAGFWIEPNSDSVATGTGNGSWTGTSALFYVDGAGNKTELTSWTFDTLKWSAAGPNNFTPTLDITLTLDANNWALVITGDTQGGGNPISFSGANPSGDALINGLNKPYVAAFEQAENPGIIFSIDRVVATQVGTLIVPTPLFSTPEYGYNTNTVNAGETVSLSSAVMDTAGTPSLKWQLEDLTAPGTFTNLPSGTATNVLVNTSGLGDSQPRGLRLIAIDGGNSVTSSVVTLTVNAGSAPVLVTDIIPAGPTNVVNLGSYFTFSATFTGNLPLTNQWQKSPDGVTWTNIPNATSSSLVFNSAAYSYDGYYRLFVSNAIGNNNSSTNYMLVTNTNPKFVWSAPVSFLTLNANQILTNFPGTKIAGAMRVGGGPTAVTLTSGSSIVFANLGNWAGISGGWGTFGGARNNAFDTGNANLNTCLDNFYVDGGTYAITFSNLVVGQQYSVQLFALDNRTLTPPASSRTFNWQNPADANDVSATYAESDNKYVVGMFYASNVTETVQENLLAGTGNFNCLVLRAVGWNPPPYIVAQPANGGGYLGGSTLVTASVAGDSTVPSPAITYQWKSGPSGGPYTNLVEGAKWSGTTTATLTVNNLTADDTTPVYVLVASNGGGSTTSREVTLNIQAAPSQDLLGHWLAGTASLADTANFVAPGTFDGSVVGGGSYYFTNDVPPSASLGSQSLYLYNSSAIVINNTSLTTDAGYQNTFDDVIQNHFTIMFWAKPMAGGWNPWVSKYGENGQGWQLRNYSFSSASTFTVRNTGSPGGDDPVPSINSNDGQWHHYAGTFDTVTGLRYLYVDGNLSFVTFGNGPYTLPTASHLMLGARDSGGGSYGSWFTGDLYDVRIYDYALSATQIRTISGVKPPSPAIQAVSGKPVVTWSWGTLLDATNIIGPWHANAATSPYTNNPTDMQHYFRIQNP